MGTSCEDGPVIVTFILRKEYYFEHKEVLNNFIMKGTSTSIDGVRRRENLINWLQTPPVGGLLVIDDPAFISFLRLTGGL